MFGAAGTPRQPHHSAALGRLLADENSFSRLQNSCCGVLRQTLRGAGMWLPWLSARCYYLKMCLHCACSACNVLWRLYTNSATSEPGMFSFLKQQLNWILNKNKAQKSLENTNSVLFCNLSRCDCSILFSYFFSKKVEKYLRTTGKTGN